MGPVGRLLLPVVAVLALALGACGTSESAPSSDTQPHDDADVAFAAAMVPHHEQALQMVAMTSGRRLPPDFEALTEGVADAQQTEIDEMRGWLEDWRLEDGRLEGGRRAGSAMRGMSRAAPGTVSDDDLGELTSTTDPAAFERRWLRMMIAHHEGAVAMARTELDHGSYPPALELARSIIDMQSAEIDRMERMLRVHTASDDG